MIFAMHDDHFFGDHGWFDGGFGLGFPEIFLGLLFFGLQVAFWVVVVVLVVRLIRGRGGEHRERSPSAIDVLEERYARGEITGDEFAERRAVLLGREPPPRSDRPPQPL